MPDMGDSIKGQTIKWVLERPDQIHTAQSIMTGLGLDKSHRSMIARTLSDEIKSKTPRIERLSTGFYKALYSQPDGLKGELQGTRPLFHGLVLHGALHSQKGGSPPLVSPSQAVSLTESHRHHSGLTGLPEPPQGREVHLGWFESLGDGPKELSHTWRGRAVKITIHPTAIDIRSRFSDDPVTPEEMDSYVSFLEGLFYPYFWTYHWTVKSLGVNKDFKDLKMDGIQSLTLTDLQGVIKRWYLHKGCGLRRETHSPVNVPLVELLNNLDGLSCLGHQATMTDNERTREAIVELTREVQRMRAWTNKLADKVISLKDSNESILVNLEMGQ